MKKCLLLFMHLAVSVTGLLAAAGDTTLVRVFDQFSMNRYGNFDTKVMLPDATKQYQRIWLKYTLGCESNGQCEWDYTIKLHVRQHTGRNDSTLKQAPYLKVNGTAKDSVSYSSVPTWINSYNATTRQTDSALSATMLIALYDDPANPLLLTDTIRVYASDYYRYSFDTSGRRTDSVWVPATHTIYQKLTPYYEVFEVVNNFELGRFISPYAKSFPKSFKYDYVYDVTDYVSLFNSGDSTEFRIEYQGYSYGFTATWDMIYVEGRPAREVIAVEGIYNGGFDYGQSESIETRLSAKPFTAPPGTVATKARIIITGHGMDANQNCAEFCAKKYFLKVNNAQVAEKLVWKDDCGSNAIAAQPGTWVYNRANWCPGEKVRNIDHWIDVPAGSSNTIDLDMEPFIASGGASYNISMVLFYYKENAYRNDASIEEVIAPGNDQWHNKVNPVCDHARIVIKNWGSDRLTRALVSFRVGDGNLRVQEWAGDLGYEEEAEVFLPYIDWPLEMTDTIFKVWISSVNGTDHDENLVNNTKHVPFTLPPVMASSFIIETRTNNVPAQNAYTIVDAHGMQHYSRTFSQGSTLYRDTISLGFGCYTLKFTDSGGNGIAWWAAPGEGTGFVRLRPVNGSTIIRTFNPDFGSFIQYSFRVQHAVGLNEAKEGRVNVYPNPANEVIFIEGVTPVRMVLSDITGKICMDVPFSPGGMDVRSLPAGVYLLRLLMASGESFTRKVSIVK